MVHINVLGLDLRLMLDEQDFEQTSYSVPNLAFTCSCIYISLWVVQLSLNFAMALFGGDICGNAKSRDVISRLLVDAIAMFLCCIFGYQGFVSLNGFAGLSEGTAYDRV